MATHTYWRINVTANDGGTSLAIVEVEMRGSKGGADQCVGGTASASSAAAAPNDAAAAFDNSSPHWNTAGAATTGWLRYQFASPVDVLQYTIQAHGITPNRAPKEWTFEHSDDGSSWTVADTRTSQTGWTANEIRTFNVDGVTVARVSQVPVEVLRTNLAVKARTSQVAVEVLRINTGTVIRTSQLAVEVLRPNVAAASATARPVVFVAT